MMKTIATGCHASVHAYPIALRVILFSIIFFLLLLSSNTAMAQEISSHEQEAPKGKQTDNEEPPAFDERFKSDEEAKDKLFFVTLHRANYFLGVTYNDNPNVKTYEDAGRDIPNELEAKFQISFKMLIQRDLFGGGDLFAAYTQRSMWQIYETSSPFRETNYEPELFLKFDTRFNFLGLHNKLFFIGVNHQSNGQGGEFSRSWNRIYIEFIARRGNFLLGLKPWYRIPESIETDDNPDIDEYLGYGELFGAYKIGRHVVSFSLHNNLRSSENRSAVEIGWSYPVMKNLRIYLQYYNGYGESLIDYNNFTNRIGIGFIINDWF